ncbi:aspartate kinase [Vibrio europaeus]|uniref:amino acid kinase family protein n=1 Tax=Vibrio oreintalis group TaxID=1891919 RepID=UPI0018A75E76|nr:MULTISPECIES: aspartate kinase [Vibrio oreintalis group]MCG9579383.1 aspartate kinase [Vibrio tubiashii]MDC5808192.1 aspartate kinase [Vibrio europaeus]QPG38214.1 aspartate kinase [Vibrio europaeus]
MSHTVEKVSGSSMVAFDTVLDNIILKPDHHTRYNRILVVPAYKGITDALLENKRTYEPGVYQFLRDGDQRWEARLESVIQRLLLVNESVFADPMLRRKADDFIVERVACTRRWLHHHLSRDHKPWQASNPPFWRQIRERLAAIGEAHSAYNTALKARRHGVDTKFIDLSGAPHESRQSLDHQVWSKLGDVDLSNELPVVTAYAPYEANTNGESDRRYGDLTLSRIATLTAAKQAIIHKCHHLSSGDPAVIGAEHVHPVRQSSYQMANQLSELANDVVHPAAMKELAQQNIDLRVKCTFEPEHPGTFISHHPSSQTPKVEVVSGNENVCALRVEVTNRNVDISALKDAFRALPNVTLLHQETSATSVNHYFDCAMGDFGLILSTTKKRFPDAEFTVQPVALLSVLGTTLDPEPTLAMGCNALESHGISPVSTYFSDDENCVKFVVASAQFRAALCALHDAFLAA